MPTTSDVTPLEALDGALHEVMHGDPRMCVTGAPPPPAHAVICLWDGQKAAELNEKLRAGGYVVVSLDALREFISDAEGDNDRVNAEFCVGADEVAAAEAAFRERVAALRVPQVEQS